MNYKEGNGIMNIAILQITDAHMESDFVLDKCQIELMISAIKNSVKDVSKIIVAFTGDLTQRGDKKEFNSVKKFYNKISDIIKEEIGCECINCIIPGNHDVEFESGYLDDEKKFQKEYKSLELESKYDKRLNNFFSFLKNNNYGLFEKSKKVDKKIINIDGTTIKIGMINTAYNSLLTSNMDKGYHTLDKKEIDFLREDEADISIMFMHHPISWFDWQSEQMLNKLINDEYLFVFEGHEHFSNKVEIKNDNNLYFKILTDEFVINNVYNSFSLTVINPQIRQYSYMMYKYDSNDKLFVNHINEIGNFELKNKKNRVINLNQSFEEEMTKDLYTGQNVNSIFIFPNMKYDYYDGDSQESKSIENLNDFFKIIENKRIVEISGDDYSGKSILVKILFMNYVNNGCLPIVLDKENIKHMAPQKLIDKVFSLEYENNTISRSKFNQSDKKILIIDDFESIINPSIIFDYAKSIFSKIIIFKNNVIDVDLIEQIVEKVDTNSENISLSICPLSRNKRKELIRELCLSSNKFKTVDDLNNKVDVIESYLQKQQIGFKTDPVFVINLTQFQLDKIGNYTEEKAVFSSVFEASIINKLHLEFDSVDTDIAMKVLSQIAFKTHINKKYPMDYNEVVEIMSQYAKEYEVPIDVNAFYQKIIDAKILKTVGDSKVRFVTKYYFAYFVANGLLDVFKDNQTEGKNEILKILSNSCYGINSEVLVYFSFITHDESIRKVILEQAKKNLSGINPFSLDDRKYSFVYPYKNFQISEPSKDDVKESNDKVDKKEQAERKKYVKISNIYDYTDVDESNINNNLRLTRASKYLEIIGKIYGGFFYTIKNPLKAEYAVELKKEPTQILTLFFDFFADNYDLFNKVIDDILKKSGVTTFSSKLIIALECIIRIIYEFDIVTSYYSNEYTINNMKFDSDDGKNNKLYQVQKLFAISKLPNNHKYYFEFAAQLLKKYNKDKVITLIIQYYTRLYMGLHNISKTGDNELYKENRSFIECIFESEKKSKDSLLPFKELVSNQK